MNRFLALVCLVPVALFAAACGTTSDAAPAPKQAAAPTDHDTCIAVMTKNRACTDDYIPALVDSRARADQPAGIRDAVAKDRAAVITQAKAEWADDSKDPAIAAMCERMTAQPLPQDLVAMARGCLAKDACGAYVACITPVFEKHLSK